jgi:hypothetical protein
MNPRKVISPSLYPQLEVEIEGLVYKLKPLNRAVFENVAAMQKAAEAGDPGAVGIAYDQIALFIDAPKEVIDAMDYRVIREVLSYITETIVKNEGQTEEKKEPGPGAEHLPS